MADTARLPRLAVFDRRRAGVLLPLFSLDRGAGALGDPAREFIDWLAAAGFSVWQLLPVGPTGADGSPYWLRSDYAADTRLNDRAVVADDFAEHFPAWRAANEGWLADYALFEAIARAERGRPWTEWPQPLRDREPAALTALRHAHAEAIDGLERAQFHFDRQWQAMRAYAHVRGVRLFGDLPIYVAPDSVETWLHRAQFQLDAAGRSRAVAGVPPDYFATDGQLWGNSLYDWRAMEGDAFRFWRARVRRALQRFDLLRLDHFRGLTAYWSVSAGAATAREGTWQQAPGEALLRELLADSPDAPFVAEDLGVITPEVEQLRDRFGLPGMRVLQFAFDGDGANPHAPHAHIPRSVVYTGTHDNDTTLGWYRGLDAETLQRVNFYVGHAPREMPDALVRLALASVAQLAVLPIADVLGLDSAARINTPATLGGNWRWRLPAHVLTPQLARHHSLLNRVYGRA